VWKVIGASVAGSSHQKNGTGCEDASGWREWPGVTCLAVADGAGSRPMSGSGAALAVQRALVVVGECAARPGAGEAADWIRTAFSDARGRIEAMAADEGRDVGDYGTTLGVAVLTGDAVCIGQLGDTIAVVGHAGEYRTVAPAPRGEYANETNFVTDVALHRLLRLTILPAAEADAVVLSTDGLRFKILDLSTTVPYRPFFEDLVTYAHTPEGSVEGIERFLSGLENDQSGDDKTLVAAVRTGPDA
jgi:hypothetical protein